MQRQHRLRRLLEAGVAGVLVETADGVDGDPVRLDLAADADHLVGEDEGVVEAHRGEAVGPRRLEPTAAQHAHPAPSRPRGSPWCTSTRWRSVDRWARRSASARPTARSATRAGDSDGSGDSDRAPVPTPRARRSPSAVVGVVGQRARRRRTSRPRRRPPRRAARPAGSARPSGRCRCSPAEVVGGAGGAGRRPARWRLGRHRCGRRSAAAEAADGVDGGGDGGGRRWRGRGRRPDVRRLAGLVAPDLAVPVAERARLT